MLILADWDGVPPAQAGPLGLLVIFLLGVAVFFLYKSMNKQLRKLPESFDPPEAAPPAAEVTASEDSGEPTEPQ